MLLFSETNLIAVLIATAASMGIGFFWYSQKGFGLQWMKYAHVQSSGDDMSKALIQGAVSTFVKAYVVGLILALVNPASLPDGILLGILLWLGMASYVVLGRVIWERAPVQLYWINAGYELVTTLVMILILMSWPS